MNENPEIASNWKGRVLLQVSAFKTDKPVAKVCRTENKLVQEAQEETKDNTYSIIAEVGQAICLPKKNKKYTVKIIVGGEVLETKEAKVVDSNYNRWNERMQKLEV
jgi:hypothetical protein